jgi:DNA-binding CsgD family transcriptional regulator
VADQSILRARIKQRLGDPEASVREIQRLLAAAAADGDTTTELRGNDQLGGVRFEQGRMAEAIEAYRRGADHAARIGRRWSPHGLDAVVMAAQAAFIVGDWDECLALSTGSEDAPDIARASLDLGVLAVGAGRGDVSALELLPGLRRWWPYDTMITINCTPAIELYAEGGDLAAAVALHDEIAAALHAVYGPYFIGQVRLTGVLLGILVDAAARAPSDGTERLELLSRAEDGATAARATILDVERVRTLGPEAYAWAARVEAERLLLLDRLGEGVDPATLIAAWEDAIEKFGAYSHAFETARSRARLAAVLLNHPEDDHFDRSAELITGATHTAQRLGARPLLTELQRLGAGVPTAPAAAPREDPVSNPLTQREREVLDLVAEGLSNTEVGRRLVISAKTASVHVSNILAKLGGRSRTEAVTIARRRGLLS